MLVAHRVGFDASDPGSCAVATLPKGCGGGFLVRIEVAVSEYLCIFNAVFCGK